MNDILNLWSQWLRPSAGLAAVHWAILLALASIAGYLCQRHMGMPKVVGYSLVGALAGFLGFSGVQWPLQGAVLFLVELGASVVLFECGGRITLRWFRHNPMVLVQSILESALSFTAVYLLLRLIQLDAKIAAPLAIIAMASSPLLLRRVAEDMHAAGPVTDRAMVLATLSTLYMLTLGSAQAQSVARPEASLLGTLASIMVVLGVSAAMAVLLGLLMRLSLRIMSPTSENTSILMLALIAATTAVSSHLGGSAPLSALLGGLLLKHLHPRPWAWPRQMGTASTLLTMLMFVLVSGVAATASWGGTVVLAVLALVGARLLAKTVGVTLGNLGSGTSWRQSIWVACAMTPMSAVALLITSQYVLAMPQAGPLIAGIALPVILLLELAGSAVATWALHRAGEGAGWREIRHETGTPSQTAPAPLMPDTSEDRHAA